MHSANPKGGEEETFVTALSWVDGRCVQSVEDSQKYGPVQRFLFFCERTSNILRFTSLFVDVWFLFTEHHFTAHRCGAVC